MKKLACLLLAALLLFCFSGCEEGTPTAGSTPSTDPQEDIVLLDKVDTKTDTKLNFRKTKIPLPVKGGGFLI